MNEYFLLLAQLTTIKPHCYLEEWRECKRKKKRAFQPRYYITAEHAAHYISNSQSAHMIFCLFFFCISFRIRLRSLFSATEILFFSSLFLSMNMPLTCAFVSSFFSSHFSLLCFGNRTASMTHCMRNNFFLLEAVFNIIGFYYLSKKFIINDIKCCFWIPDYYW